MEQETTLKRCCPLTRGNPTSMLRASWDACCAASRNEAEEELDIGNRHIMFKGACLVCNGEPPAEVTFIELPAITTREEGEMGTVKTWNGTCYACEESRKVRRSGEKAICARCDHLRAEIRLRPDLVVKIVREIAPDLLGKGEHQTDDRANCETCDVASWATSYQQLRGVLLVDDGEDLVEVAKRRMATMQKLEATFQLESVARSSAEAERDNLKRKLGELMVPLHAGEYNLDRHALKDLALRLAIGVMKGEIEGVDHADVELLRSC